MTNTDFRQPFKKWTFALSIYFLSQLYELSFWSKKCTKDCSLIRELLGGPLSLGMRFSEPLSMTTDLELFLA